MKLVTVVAASLMLLLLAAPVPSAEAHKKTKASKPKKKITDVDILNFALNLEYLEAEFYSWAAFGKGLPAKLRGYGPASVGGKKANLTKTMQAYAEEIALDEIAHVRLLRTALGKRAVKQPAIDIGPVFAALTKAALAVTPLPVNNTTPIPPFDAYENDITFLLAAFIFEDVGVTAYKGAAPLLKSKAYLAAAAGLLGTEAYHAGALRAILLPYSQLNFIPGCKECTIEGAVQIVSNVRDAADGPVGKDKGLFDGKRRPVLAPGDKNRIVWGRSPAEVLSIVTLGAKNGKGGFFPKGLNGKIR